MSTNPPIAVRLADLDDPTDRRDVVAMVEMYASDAAIEGAPLSAEVKQRLAAELPVQPMGRHFLAFADDSAVGVAICFLGFSTFFARPLINIHDLAVVPPYRGQGVGRMLLDAVEQLAVDLDCCKLTLEVRADNDVAQRLYRSFGFRSGDDPATNMEFWTKPLATTKR